MSIEDSPMQVKFKKNLRTYLLTNRNKNKNYLHLNIINFKTKYT